MVLDNFLFFVSLEFSDSFSLDLSATTRNNSMFVRFSVLAVFCLFEKCEHGIQTHGLFSASKSGIENEEYKITEKKKRKKQRTKQKSIFIIFLNLFQALKYDFFEQNDSHKKKKH